MKKTILLSTLFCLSLLGCKEEAKMPEPIRPVRVFTTNAQVSPEMRTFPGEVKATREAELAFRVSGQVVQLNVKEGDTVEKGQLIAQLDQRDFQAAVADLEAKLAGATSVLNEARLNIERNRKLLSGKIIAQSAYDAAMSNYETSRANALSLEQSLRRARLNLQHTRLEAPFAGTIAIKQIDNHEYIQAKEPIVQLEDTSSLDVVINLPESVWFKAFKGGKANMAQAVAAFESFPGRTFKLTMKEFQTKSNPGTQTYEVTMNMANPEGLGVHPGMTAEVISSMPENSVIHTVCIPVASVTGTPEGPQYVWVLGEGYAVEKREVQLGRIMQDMFTVNKGLSQGETIVVAGVNYLCEGQKVKVLEGRIGGRK